MSGYTLQSAWVRRSKSRLGLVGAMILAGFSLSGCVGAAMVAGTSAGVMVAQERSVGDGIDDVKIDLEIGSLMNKQENADLSGVNTSVNEGRVLLTGLVQRPEDRIAAARAAWSHPQVKEVVNDIEIGENNKWRRIPKDTWITSQIRARYTFDTELRGINYDIEVVDGTVYLLGIAQDEFEMQRAAQHASSVNGVKKVISHVQLKSGRDRQALVLGQR